MIVNTNRMWTQLVSVVYRLRRRPMVSNRPDGRSRRVAAGRRPNG